MLASLQNAVPIDLDFAGVRVVTPSWLDEVLTALRQDYGDRVRCLPSSNASLRQSLVILKAIPPEGPEIA